MKPIQLVTALIATTATSALATPVATSGVIRLNTTTPNNQQNAAVALQPAGFVTAWDGAGASPNVFTSGFTTAGDESISQRIVNQFLPGVQQQPAIATRPDGTYVVAYEDEDESGNRPIIAFRRFDAAGDAQGAPGFVTSLVGERQRAPDIAQLPGGKFAIVWTEFSLAGSQIVMQLFTSLGASTSGKIVVNTTLSGEPERAKVAVDGLGRLIVVWQGDDLDEEGSAIAARLFNSNGSALTGEFVVNSNQRDDPGFPAVAADPEGNFVVVWEIIIPDAGPFQVAGQRFTASAEPLGGEFRVGIGVGADQNLPVVGMASDQTFVVAFEAPDFAGDDGRGVFVQRLDFLTGVPVGAVVRANDQVAGDQANPDITVGADGRMALVWKEQEANAGVVYDAVGKSFLIPALERSDDRPAVAVRGRQKRKTSKSKFRLRGTASDDGIVAAVEFKTRGKFRTGKLRGTTRWTLQLRLKKGRNVVRFRAVDEAGQTSRVERVVVRRR